MRAAFLSIAVWPVMLVSFAPRRPGGARGAARGRRTGIGFALFDVFWNTTMAEQIPPHALSRASAYEWMGSLILLPVGYLAAGPVAEATSTETVLVGRRDPHRRGARRWASSRARHACSSGAEHRSDV